MCVSVWPGLGEFGCVNRVVLAHFIELDDRNASRLGCGDAEGDLDAVNLAIVGVVNLSGVAA